MATTTPIMPGTLPASTSVVPTTTYTAPGTVQPTQTVAPTTAAPVVKTPAQIAAEEAAKLRNQSNAEIQALMVKQDQARKLAAANIDRNKVAKSLLAGLGYTGDTTGTLDAAQFNAWKATGDNAYKLKAATDAEVARLLAAQNQPIGDLLSQQVTNPALPNGTELVPQLQTVQSNEIQAYNDMAAQTPVTASTVVPATQINAAQVNPAQIVDINGQQYQIDPSTGNYTPVLLNNAAQITPEQMTVSAQSTVAKQMEDLTNFEDGNIPMWAKGMYNKANDVLAARGLGSSTIAGGAIAGALSAAALPIAQQDAATYFQTDIANFTARQTAALENAKLKQQQMLSDQGAANAALQFNAANEMQTQQFMANLAATIDTANANRVSATEQFNAQQANVVAAQNAANEIDVNKFNAQLKDTAEQFNANVAFQREQFNSNMRFAIDQSNVNWRRAINTANTAAINAANQVNVQNLFNLSQVAQNNLWQQWRDEASWMYESNENAANRAFSLAMLANEQNFQLQAASQQNDANSPSLGELAGSFVTNLFS